ncbi:MAG: hydrogenase [Phycisphaeraceae bacterium]|nr:hydrogenase [Phycisphaeraceae bacterium]
MAFALIILPLLAAALAVVVPCNRRRPWLLPSTGLAHLALTVWALTRPDLMVTTSWLVLDPPGRIILLLVSVLFLICSFYSVGYLQQRQQRSNRVFCACLLAFLGMMSLVTWSHHLGLMWVAIEATTLASAPLIYFNHTQHSIEATWKYLLVCSVGIALALLGTFFLAYASLHQGLQSTLLFEDLLHDAPRLSKSWLHAAFVLLLVGYGTKMGLAPMHTWLPDAHSEAPSPVSALLSGALLPCAFLAILRIYHICHAAGEDAYPSRLLWLVGLFSMAVAGVFMVGQRDFKRMLAYSSVEHMGILALGLGIGGPALFGTMLHVVNHGVTKCLLFLSAGNIYHTYGSKSTDQVRGVIRLLPLSGSLFLVGVLAITGSPPFAPFISIFAILNGAFDAGRFVTAGLFLFLLLVVFIGMGATLLQVVQGRPPAEVRHTPYRDDVLSAVPIVVCLAFVLLLGLVIPAPLNAMIHDVVHYLETQP